MLAGTSWQLPRVGAAAFSADSDPKELRMRQNDRLMTATYEAADLAGSEMVLEREGTEVCIRIGHRTLMASDAHDSEDELGRTIASAVAEVATPRILIGGLGLGFTL